MQYDTHNKYKIRRFMSEQDEIPIPAEETVPPETDDTSAETQEDIAGSQEHEEGMNCVKCGKAIPESNFCAYCGEKTPTTRDNPITRDMKKLGKNIDELLEELD